MRMLARISTTLGLMTLKTKGREAHEAVALRPHERGLSATAVIRIG